MSTMITHAYKHDPYTMAIPATDSDAESSVGSVGPAHLIAPALPPQKTVLEVGSAEDSDAAYRVGESGTVTTTEVPKSELADDLSEKAPFVAVQQLPPEVLAQVCSFLPLDALETFRAVGPAVFEEAASLVVPRPLPTTDVVFVRYEPRPVTTGVASDPALVAEFTASTASRRPTAVPLSVFPWRCMSCGSISVGPRNCRHCHATLSQAACRVFLGQIRKDLSAEMAQAMLRSLVPTANVLHIESHTNAGDGRGKGCAWVYVDSVEDALLVTSLHKRVFVDEDCDGFEGYWFVKDSPYAYAQQEHLAVMADTLAANPNRRRWLPRQPLVAELPARSLLASYVHTM